MILPRMIAGHRPPRLVIRNGLSLYASLGIPVSMGVATLPAPFTGALFPSRYGDLGSILPWSALAGLSLGLVTLTTTTYLQATGRFRRTSALLVVGVALCTALEVFGLRRFGTVGLAAIVAIGGGLVGLALLREMARTWPGALTGMWRPTVLAAAGCLPLVALRHRPVAWCLWALGCALVFGLRTLVRSSSDPAGRSGPARTRVLHLGYEDPRGPGSDGGSVRTHEINRRLADALDITVVCARYPGARPRLQDGVRYVHVGVPVGDFCARLAYFASLPYALVRYRSDLVVQDFGAPFSSVAAPWMTVRPVLGVVQWLFATEKRARYHLPFHWVEEVGVRSLWSLIAVSDHPGQQPQERHSAADVTATANHLDPVTDPGDGTNRSGIVCLGRLEIARKGLDLLIEAFARIAHSVDQDLVLAGDGPDRDALGELAGRLGVADRVCFVGRIAAADRFEWLASADLVAMPSRDETSGLVAAEALAVRTPVVAFDVPCLRALVDDRVGSRVTAFDVDAFAHSLQALATDAPQRRRMGAAGPGRLAGLTWDELAAHQGRVYRHVLEATRPAVGPAGGAVVDRSRSPVVRGALSRRRGSEAGHQRRVRRAATRS